ncbi:ArsR family transcriptional regulator [Nonomuraea turcica]|uniref:ArsR family transcriptional regulator n=1 Tax=Nonomuraea sp. G32 TaxID=3067274 RepID=UPI00273BD698|nr:ArsR family transcriptional regulator [Nonomuraea sp. G32]MDP4511750.1 ArsR family transcriptional regulator [Nonomuraea sp. G32]
MTAHPPANTFTQVSGTAHPMPEQPGLDGEPVPPALPHRDRSRAYFARTAADLNVTPFELVQFMIDAVPNFATLHAAVRLEVFEILAGQEMTSDELAQACGADPGAMRRLLRWLHAHEFVAARRDRYRLTDLGHVLTKAAAPSQRHAVLVTGSPYWWEASCFLVETVRRGHPTPSDGLSLYEHLTHNPALGADFDHFMTARSTAAGHDLAAIDDFAHVRTVADLGGGLGGVLAAILRAHRHLQGILAERADVAARAQTYLAEQGLADRVKLAPGDLFDAIPASAQRYLLLSVLHNYSDDDCLTLLTLVRQTMEGTGEDTELWIVEGMLPSVPGAASRWYSTDIRMMALFGGGQVRSSADYYRLTERAGLTICKSMALASGQTLLIARDCHTAHSAHEHSAHLHGGPQ